jgi:hypothetical protein
MRTLVGSIALAALAHAEALTRYQMEYGVDLGLGPMNPSHREPTKYRAPEPDHANHISKAEDKRARKAAKLNELSKRGAPSHDPSHSQASGPIRAPHPHSRSPADFLRLHH